MSSLRARLIAAVLILSATGMVLLGAVTYAEQRSFLMGRVDQQARSAVPAISQRLDSLGYRPSAPGLGTPPAGSEGQGHGGRPFGDGGGFGGTPRPEAVNLPPGTFGQRLEASGQPLGNPVRIKYSASESIPAAPKLPAKVPVEQLFTTGSTSGDTHYRVYVARDPEDTGLTVVAVPLTDVDQTLSRLRLVEGLVIAGVLLVLGITASFVVRLGLRPLNRMEVTAGAIAAGDLSHRVTPADTRSEVGRLGLALNRMLDRLEQAFSERRASEQRLRRFLADASHELRTPLASIRGYAELFRMGATRDGEETARAMRRIEEESTRMGVLVEDMLTLARLDETPEARHERVDLARLARNAVADARATAPERQIAVEAPERADVVGDPHQLHQVVANLMRNALVHTPAATPIEVAVESEEGELVLSVRDHGPGLPPGPPQRLFDRFWRSEGGRERGRAGAGLGLAIVREIVEAHHGGIEAADAPGGGAIFTVRLPPSPSSPPAEEPRGEALRKL
jgi:two-component system OmpR family sensor kinase